MRWRGGGGIGRREGERERKREERRGEEEGRNSEQYRERAKSERLTKRRQVGKILRVREQVPV